jgi:hypothetical protein
MGIAVQQPANKDEKPVVPAVVEVPPSPNADTDKRVSEVLNEKKKKKHPVEARIAELTKKNAAIEEKAAKDKADLEAKLAEQNEKNIKAELDRRTAEAAASEKRPTKEDYPNEVEFSQKMAEWVLRQQEKITPKVAPVVPPPEPVNQPYRKEEFDGFLENGKKFMTSHPDFNETLQKASERGLNLDNQAMVAIIKLKAPEIAYYLAKPENEDVARKFMQLDGFTQAVEVGRIAERLAVNPNDFVSSAGSPGRRLTGDARTSVNPDQMDVDTYLRQRRADIKAGLRRR